MAIDPSRPGDRPVADVDATVVDRLRRHALGRPRAPALVSSARCIDYAQLGALVSGCAEWLREQDVGPGECVGVRLADDVEHVVVALALASLGASHATLASHDPPAVRARFAARSGARRQVASDEVDRGAVRLAFDPDRMAAWRRARPDDLGCPDPEARLTCFSTSGTTGEAKLIPLTHHQFAAQCERALVGRVLPLSSIEHQWVMRQFLYAVFHGSTIVLRDANQPVAQQCASSDVDLVVGMNAQVDDLVGEASRHGRLPPSTVLLASGARGSAAFRRRLLDEVADAVGTTYSAMELGSIARRIERDRSAVSDAVGVPHPGVVVEIVDADGAPCPPGESGAIRVRAPGMATGYLDDPRADARHFRDGAFMPGDLASLDAAGELVIHGRADDVMNLNGIKIAPQEIERALESHPAVRAVAAFAVPSGVHGDIPHAAVELVRGSTVDERALQAFARDALGRRAPRRVMIVDALPLTSRGKVDRRDLVERALHGRRS